MNKQRLGLGTAMNAQQLAGDDDEQSSGYRCSGSPAGVRKCARVRVVEQRREVAGEQMRRRRWQLSRRGHACSAGGCVRTRACRCMRGYGRGERACASMWEQGRARVRVCTCSSKTCATKTSEIARALRARRRHGSGECYGVLHAMERKGAGDALPSSP